MIDNQKGRRNLTDGWRYQLAQAKKDILAEVGRYKLSEAGSKHNGNQYTEKLEPLSIVDKGSNDTAPLSTIDNGPKHNTQKEIAKDLGWSTGKVAMADKVIKNSAPRGP